MVHCTVQPCLQAILYVACFHKVNPLCFAAIQRILCAQPPEQNSLLPPCPSVVFHEAAERNSGSCAQDIPLCLISKQHPSWLSSQLPHTHTILPALFHTPLESFRNSYSFSSQHCCMHQHSPELRYRDANMICCSYTHSGINQLGELVG